MISLRAAKTRQGGILSGLPGKKPAWSAPRALHDGAVARSRDAALYARMGAPDTVEGRFEVLTLHLILLIDRLGRRDPAEAAARQALFDVYLADLDGALREMGVGDLAVGKRMRRLGEAFYGRASAYETAFAALPDAAPLQALIARTVLHGASDTDPAPLADYVARCRVSLARGDSSSLLAGAARWPDP